MTEEILMNEKIKKMALDTGFTVCEDLDVKTLECLDSVRKMCEVNTCGKYGKNWACPPGCGSIDENNAKIKNYTEGIIVQTIGEVEDSFDWDGIMAAEKKHSETFRAFAEKSRKLFPDCLPLTAGSCTICSECTYPDAPCRFPEKSMSSMEAFGLFVSDVCTKNNVEYNYGEGKICFTGCFLYNL